MTDDEIREVFAELQRVGVDLGRPPGLALGTGFRDVEFLAWLRALPDALGHDEFVARLSEQVSAAQPNAVALPARPDGQPHRMWPTVEQLPIPERPAYSSAVARLAQAWLAGSLGSPRSSSGIR